MSAAKYDAQGRYIGSEPFGPNNPPRLKKKGESDEAYRIAMGWDQPKAAKHTPGPCLQGYPSAEQADVICRALRLITDAGLVGQVKAFGPRGNGFEISTPLDGGFLMRRWVVGIDAPDREKFADVEALRAAIAKATGSSHGT